MFPFFNMYSSKAEQILSRYRPIAPKPPSAPSANASGKPDQAAGAVDSSAPAHSSSSVSLGCKKSGRKRSGDYSLASPRSYKRSASANRKNQQQQQQQQQIHLQIQQQSQQIVPALVDVGGSLSTVTSMGSEAQALPALESVGWKIVRPGVALGPGSIGNTSPRSYAMSPNLVLEDAGSSVIAMPPVAAFKSSGGGGCGGYDVVAHKNTSSNSRSLVSDLASNGFVSSNVQQISPPRSVPVPPQLSPPPAAHITPLPQEQATRAAEEHDGEERPKLVTLSLLPDTPALSNPSTSGFDLRDQDRDRDRDVANRLELSLCSGSSSQRYTAAAHYRAAAVQSSEQRVPQFLEHFPPHQNQSRQDVIHRQGAEFGRVQQPLIDSSYLEQAYGGSSDPVVLTDDSAGAGGGAGSVVLWSNLSYNKMVSERLGGKPQRAAGPYIDPLGHPTQLGRFTYRMHGSECSAVLWGFLKKFMLLDHSGFQNSSTLAAAGGEFVEQNASSNDLPHQHQLHSPSNDLPHHHQLHSPSPHNHQQNHLHHQGLHHHHHHQQQQHQGRVIAPQPIRLVVGSTVCLDSISKLDSYSGHLSGSLESVESQLEKDGVPALVTDRSNRVRWVNSAYNQLVSASSSSSSAPNASNSRADQQQESGSSNKSNGASSEPAPAASSDRQPEVCVTFQSERSPYSAVSLVGQARVDWMDGGKRCCLTGVPCEMRRLDDQQRGSLFVWKLNLNVGTVRHGQSAAAAAAAAPVALHHFQAGQQLGQDCFGARERGFI